MRARGRRGLVLRQRRRVSAMRRFEVEHVGGGRLRYTCKTCGHSSVKEGIGPGQKGKMDPKLAERLARYQSQGGGAIGRCAHCTKKVRDEMYPLPREEKKP